MATSYSPIQYAQAENQAISGGTDAISSMIANIPQTLQADQRYQMDRQKIKDDAGMKDEAYKQALAVADKLGIPKEKIPAADKYPSMNHVDYLQGLGMAIAPYVVGKGGQLVASDEQLAGIGIADDPHVQKLRSQRGFSGAFGAQPQPGQSAEPQAQPAAVAQPQAAPQQPMPGQQPTGGAAGTPIQVPAATPTAPSTPQAGTGATMSPLATTAAPQTPVEGNAEPPIDFAGDPMNAFSAIRDQNAKREQQINGWVANGVLSPQDGAKQVVDLQKEETKQLEALSAIHLKNVEGQAGKMEQIGAGQKQKQVDDLMRYAMTPGAKFTDQTGKPVTPTYDDLKEHPENYKIGAVPQRPVAAAGGKDAISQSDIDYYAGEIGAHRMSPKDLPLYVSKFRGGDESMAQILRKAKQIDPAMDIEAFKRSDKSFVENTKAVKSTMTFFANLDNLQTAIEKLPPRTTVTQLNKLLTGGQYSFGNVPITDFKTLVNVVGPEMGSSLGSGQAAVARDELSKAALNENAPISGLQAALKTLRQVETNRVVSVMLDAGPYGENWLKATFGGDLGQQMIDTEKAKRQKTGKAAAGDSGAPTGSTTIKSASGHEYTF